MSVISESLRRSTSLPGSSFFAWKARRSISTGFAFVSRSRNFFRSRCPRREKMGEKRARLAHSRTGNGSPLEMRGGVHQQNYGSRQREGSRLRMTTRSVVGLSVHTYTHTARHAHAHAIRGRAARALSCGEPLLRDRLFACAILPP